MPVLNNILLWVLKRFYPPGRAWWMPLPKQTGSYITDEAGNVITDEAGNFLVTEDYSATGGIWYRLHRALTIQFAIAYRAALGTQDFQLPDNANFTLYDAQQWYRRLGIYDSGSVSLADMKLAINAWWSNYNATLRNKQHYTYIQGQLQAAGFNVNIYENRFFPGPVTMSPDEVLGFAAGDSELEAFELDEVELNETWLMEGITLCNQYLEEGRDIETVITNLRSTFYIADPADITTFAEIPAARKTEFRQLLIKLKPAHTVGILFVNYT